MTYEQYTNGNASTRRSSQEIQSDLRVIRSEIQGTLEALGSQLQPGQLMHQVLNLLRGGSTGGRFLHNLGRAVEENPLPVALIGAGFGYLIYSDARQTKRRSGYVEGDFEAVGGEGTEEGAGLRERGSERLRHLKEGAQGRAQRMKEGAQGLRANVKDKLGATRHKMQDARSYTREEWQNVSARAKEAGARGRDLVQEQPLILAGLGLAVGAAIAALAPMSRKEHEVLGEKGRELKDQARHAAHHAAERAKAIGSEAYETAKAEALGEKGESQAESRDVEASSSEGSASTEGIGGMEASRAQGASTGTGEVGPEIVHRSSPESFRGEGI